MNILFYSSFNSRSRDTESLMLAFKQQGHHVHSLSQAAGKDIHEFLGQNGISIHSYIAKGKGISYYLRHLFFFIHYCYRNKIDIVYSHLELPSFIASLGQWFVYAKVFICRHHVDEALLYKFDKSLTYRITYLLAKNIIVVSDRAKQFMTQREHIPAHKIHKINLAYDFSLYNLPGKEQTTNVRKRFESKVLLITVCRLTNFKRPDYSIDIVRELVTRMINVKLIILGNGHMMKDLSEKVKDYNLVNNVFFLGHVSDPLVYMAAADFLVHPSLLESSCVVVKEAGLVKLPVVVCSGVGDFDEYLINEHNGFLVDADDFVSQAADIIERNISNKEKLTQIADNLHLNIIRLFNVDQVIRNYAKFNS